MNKNLLISFLCLFFQLGYFNTHAQWQKTNGIYGGAVNCMVSEGNNIFAGTNNGIYFSNDNGNSWTAKNNGFPLNLKVFSLAINGTTIYAGTLDDGIYLSENSGNSWIKSNNGLPSNISISDLAISNSTIYAGTYSSEIFLSTDNGRSWNAISISSTVGYVKSIAVSGTKIFVGTNIGLFLSTNNGISWTTVNNEPINDIAIKENYVFTVGDYGVNRSENYGITWRRSGSGIMSGVSGIYTIFEHGSSLFAGTLYSIFKSDNNGDSWSSSSIGLPTNSQAYFLASSGSTIFAGMGGFGLFKSTDNGNLWTESNNGITNTDVVSMASSGNNIFAGTYYSGLFSFNPDKNTWDRTNITTWDRWVNSIVIRGNERYVSSGTDVYYSSDNGNTWAKIGGFISNSIYLYSSDSKIIGTNGWIIKELNDDKTTWTYIYEGLPENKKILSVAISGSNIFASIDDNNGIYRSTDNGTTWTAVNNGIPLNESIYSLAVKGTRIFAGSSLSGIFLSNDNGEHWNKINNGLPNSITVRALAIDDENIFAGTSNQGVFHTSNNGLSWHAVGANPNVGEIRSIVVNKPYVFIGTNTSGVLKYKFYNNLIFPKLNINYSLIIPGQSIIATGKDFKPSGEVNITINGPDGFSQSVNNIGTDGLGGFSYSFVTTTAMPTGIYSINASDNTSGGSAPVKQFTLKSTSVQTNNLTITSPLQSIAVDVNEKFLIEWKDKMIQGKSYTINGSKRNYKYTVELSDNNGSTWKTLKTVEGQEYINSWTYLNFSTSIATPGSEYVIRITDFYNSSNVQTSPVITVNQAAQTMNIKVDLNWDFSFPQPSSQVEGVAAEGTARIFLNLSKINSGSGPDISSVKVTLTDDFNGTDPAKLGKVKVATQTSAYSSEANGIVAITATDNTAKKDNYIFWYVAPDDFAGADPKDLKSSSRIVTTTFTVYYANGTTEILPKSIRIVRPPLMLVHGLASDASTWDNFRHNDLGYELNFTEDFRFKTCVAVNILPDASFKRNAEDMTILNNPNSFSGVINDIRNKGYAANRVDYVCHSMGGCVLRSIYDNYYAYFTKTGIASNSRYKNYEKGFVNKVITIGTPNNGSPWGDIVNRYAGDLAYPARIAIQSWYGFSGADKPLPLMYMQPVDINKLVPTYKASDAVKDLQIDDTQGGVNFGVTNTKAHLIAGDFFPGAQYNTNGIIPQEIINKVKNTGDEKLQDLLLWFLKIASNKEPDPILHQQLLDILESKVEPIEKALAFFDKMAMVMDAFNTGTFIPESDLVVSVGSQLAGYSKPASNGVSNVSAFDDFVGHAFFRAETKNMDIGNRVNYLLNSNINSPLFDIIPATPAQSKLKSTQKNLAYAVIISKTDTSKLQIIHPENNSSAYVDSSFHVQFNIKDTTNLKSVELMFQNKTYQVDSLFLGTVDMNLQLNSNLLDNQKIVLEGYYLYPDSAVFVYDQINVNVISSDTLKDFGIDPKILYLFKNQIKNPEYYGIYKNSVTSGNFSSNITAIVNDTSIVKFDFTSKGFKGISPGETLAKISYEGFSDTIYFVVNDTDIDYVQHFTPVWSGNGVDLMNINVYSAKLDGVELESGDEIGIFDGSNCVGVGTLTGTVTPTNTLDIAVSRNDGSGSGYTSGDAITFKIFDKSKNSEILNVLATYSNTDPSWSTDGKFAIGATAHASLSGVTKVNQNIALNTGWNIISANVMPANVNMKDIFQTLIDAGKLKKVMDEAGKTLENLGAFGGWRNNIGTLNSGKGYKVNVTAASTLSLEGVPVQLPFDIALNTGWNIISYPSTSIQDAKAVVQSLIDAGKLKKVMDEAGKTIENLGAFGGWRNNIGNFIPGKGYKINVTANCTLTIPASGNKSAVVLPELLASEHFNPVFRGNGIDHNNINLINLQTSGLQAEDQIGVFDGNLCVGSATLSVEQLTDGTINIPTSANDELGETPNGFTEGHLIKLVFFRKGQTYPLKLETAEGNPNFVKNGSLIAKVSLADLTGIQITEISDQFKCYPNPFSDEIAIEIQTVGESKLTVEIYNMAGQRIKNLYSGTNIRELILKWDGTNDSGQTVVSGAYLCKVNGQSKQVIFEGHKWSK